VNVSKFGRRLLARGIHRHQPEFQEGLLCRVVHRRGLEASVEDGKLRIDQEGQGRKFAQRVEQKTFSGKHAARKKQSVLYVTERCVFSLCEEGLELIEVAPG